jgi:archaellum component FlaF (FlaF/FlaG flagellin family)
MASSIVSEGIVLIAVVVAAAMLSQVFLTTMTGIEQSSITMSERLGDKMKTSVKVISAVNSSSTSVKVWVKNTGTNIIPSAVVEQSDVLFGRLGEYSYVEYSELGVGWDFALLNSDDTNWQNGETMEITITTSAALATGDYYVCFNTFNGVSDEHYFSIGG